MSESNYTYLNTYRYERKFLVENLMPYQVKALVDQHPRFFRAPYPPRYVNNLYLDTPEMTYFYDNVNGAMRRQKVRVRWYGDPFGRIDSPILEVKVKDGVVGTKHSYPISSFNMNTRFCDRNFQRLLLDSDLPAAVLHRLHGMNVVLFNRYYRHYFATHDGAFRLTIDTQQEFYKVNGTFGNTFVHRQTNARDVIVELKYEIEQEPQADHVSSFFPFRVTRNSKYIQGIERVYF